LGYNDDSSRRHGLVTHFPASDNEEGAMRSVYDYDSGRWHINFHITNDCKPKLKLIWRNTT
jgi:hypothetical protein